MEVERQGNSIHLTVILMVAERKESAIYVLLRNSLTLPGGF
jgi:hypothetical protein